MNERESGIEGRQMRWDEQIRRHKGISSSVSSLSFGPDMLWAASAIRSYQAEDWPQYQVECVIKGIGENVYIEFCVRDKYIVGGNALVPELGILFALTGSPLIKNKRSLITRFMRDSISLNLQDMDF